MMSRRLLFNSIIAIGASLILVLSGASNGSVAFAQAAASSPTQPPASPSTTLPSLTHKTAASLADCVPGNILLYLEIRGLDNMLSGQTGAGMAADFIRILKGGSIGAPTEMQANAPATKLGMRQLLANALGLTDPQASQLLFSGPLAIAADGWSGLGDAVLFCRPDNPAALDTLLANQRIAGTQGKVRQYALSGNNVLACDGRSAAIGRAGKRTGLFARTVELLERGGIDSLAGQTEFRERITSLPTESQLTIYVGKTDTATGPGPLTAWWPTDWPQLKTVALTLVLDGKGATIKVSSRLNPDGPQLIRSEPPFQIIRRLPESILAAWTNAIDYVSSFRRLRTEYSQEPDGLRWEALEAGLEPGAIEKRLLTHLVGDTVLILDRIVVKPRDATDANEQLVLPTLAMMVEIDDPDAVAGVLEPLINNLMRMLNPRLTPEQNAVVKTWPVVPGGPIMYVVPLGQALAGNNRCDLLAELELCATVIDRMLLVGTHSQALQRLVKERRGPAVGLASENLDQIVEQLSSRGGQARRVMFADSQSIGAMIQTWVEHLTRHHPEMLEGRWWEKVLRRQRAMGKQLGILVRPADGVVEIVDALPGGPARDYLKSGDRILAVDGIKVDPASPLKSLREYVAGRAEAEQVVLLIRRGNETKEVTLPLPRDPAQDGLQSPVDLLNRFAAISKLFSSASYVLWQPRPDVVDARIDLRYFADPQPKSATTQPSVQ